MGYFKKDSIGDIRPNQIITTFGPGSIVDARKDSVTVLDIRFWKNKGDRILDGRLSKYLNVDGFYAPGGTGKDIPVISFPKYHVCSKCGLIFLLDDKEMNVSDYALRGVKCPECGNPAYPSRFVVMCEDGHIDEFPWRWWVHGSTKCKGLMHLKSSGNTSSLADMNVYCDCGAHRSLMGATDPKNFKEFKCTGHHPFRPDANNEQCKCPVIPSQRGASNVYFAVTRSGISIPPWTNPLNTLIEEHYKDIQNVKKYGGNIDQYYQDYFASYPRSEFDEALKKREENIKDYGEFKEMEYMAITHFNDPKYPKNKKTFTAEEEPVKDAWNNFISRIIRITRLREVVVLQGFTRCQLPDPDTEIGDDSHIVKLSSGKNEKWLPAVARMGEGIFIEFNRNTINQWLEVPSVKHINKKFEDSYKKFCNEKGWRPHTTRDAVYVLMHTFSHLIIKQMALSSGYSSSSIREKLYCGPNMAGILLYTGSDDASGSLGGLVELGKFEYLSGIIRKAFEDALMCANDPECMSHKPGENDSNGASCHACTMISETSCENSNRLLDRGLVVPLKGRENDSYFKELVEAVCQIKTI